MTLIGATTENPFFEVNKALVSRSRLFRLQSLDRRALEQVLVRALSDPEYGYGNRSVQVSPEARHHLVQVAGGDARSLLNALELAVETGIPGLLAATGLLVSSLRLGLQQLQRDLILSLPALGAAAAVIGLAGHGVVDTIFFRPEVQITGWFALATLSSQGGQSKEA